MATYVLVFGKLHNLEDKAAFEAYFKQISQKVIASTSGIIRDELISDSSDPYAYIMLSEWESKDAWAAWQRAPIHEEQVGTMRLYWQGQGVRIFNTAFCVEKSEPVAEGQLA